MFPQKKTNKTAAFNLETKFNISIFVSDLRYNIVLILYVFYLLYLLNF